MTFRAVVAALVLLTAVSGCTRRSIDDAPVQAKGAATEVRLGYFPNVTHAAALIGVEKGLFTKELGSTKLTTQTFNAGPDEVNALLGESLDIAYIGSGPAINAYAKSKGKAVKLIAGATSGGAQLVVKPEINSIEDLKGKIVATPQLANTQDVSLKKYLAEKNLTGQVTVQNVDNAASLDLFKRGDIQAAWAPQPWSARLVAEAGAKVLLDEKALWDGGTFPATVVVVRTKFLQEHPETVEAVLKGHVAAIDWAKANKDEAKESVNAALEELTSKQLGDNVLDAAWDNIELTTDAQANHFPQLAKDAVTADVAKEAANVAGYADFALLNKVLQAQGKPQVQAAGLDQK
ncbi:NitT/TauT family transport system substrate-binding protein [Lentzea albidocapillata subsp. violacea]|uniref:NitT/TauT family transport system substrate-binding protein n=1 Tax=Lentzea albidocapillata subsp. violacea TaxID=128104 RepID=A0A1G9AJP7_9PSEU|nr:ABC transporter substrate-binding protein [Lentzea albidocapillata]SDK27547.1 NitT/TauT family transport system substrate-binding protein [Lentzea albidocapillata subsp. violacea]